MEWEDIKVGHKIVYYEECFRVVKKFDRYLIGQRGYLFPKYKCLERNKYILENPDSYWNFAVYD